MTDIKRLIPGGHILDKQKVQLYIPYTEGIRKNPPSPPHVVE